MVAAQLDAASAKSAIQSDQQTGAKSKSAANKVKPSYKHVPHSQKPPHLVAKRNARERRRVQAVNQAFYKLRRCVPIENRNKRVSKVKTLQRAIDYIRKLERILEEDEEGGAQQQQQQQSLVAGQLIAPADKTDEQQAANKTLAKRRTRQVKPAAINCDQRQVSEERKPRRARKTALAAEPDNRLELANESAAAYYAPTVYQQPEEPQQQQQAGEPMLEANPHYFQQAGQPEPHYSPHYLAPETGAPPPQQQHYFDAYHAYPPTSGAFYAPASGYIGGAYNQQQQQQQLGGWHEPLEAPLAGSNRPGKGSLNDTVAHTDNKPSASKSLVNFALLQSPASSTSSSSTGASANSSLADSSLLSAGSTGAQVTSASNNSSTPVVCRQSTLQATCNGQQVNNCLAYAAGAHLSFVVGGRDNSYLARDSNANSNSSQPQTNSNQRQLLDERKSSAPTCAGPHHQVGRLPMNGNGGHNLNAGFSANSLHEQQAQYHSHNHNHNHNHNNHHHQQQQLPFPGNQHQTAAHLSGITTQPPPSTTNSIVVAPHQQHRHTIQEYAHL